MRTSSAASLRLALTNCVAETAANELLQSLSSYELAFVLHDWQLWARDDQLPPARAQGGGDWATWLLLGGRGAGKTRAGAEWVRGQALGLAPFASRSAERIALIGETLADARSVMVEGPSGLLAIHPRHERPEYRSSKRELTWPNGAVAQIFSSEDPDSLRGPQFAAAWGDELGKWRHSQETWDMLQFGLRLGERPRQVFTTTPRATPLLKKLLADPRVAISRAKTSANALHLAPSFLEMVTERYGGSRLGRQELDGELIEDRADALWRREIFDRHRVNAAPPLTRIVVAVDPPVTSHAKSDACGIVAAGVCADGCAYVLADATCQGRQPLEWARAALRLYENWQADCLVAEVNQGGDLVGEIFRQIATAAPVKQVRATRGKHVRAEPIAALYEQGRVAHVGAWQELEDQMCDFGPDGLFGGRSPDRLDALVWALTELMLNERRDPRIRSF
ncbi:MAG: terminase family protein [Hyphomicrobiales bacterium]|nr:terminase family protein [Hyphomicrobiales bacterium]